MPDFNKERALQNIFDCPLSGKLGELMIETSVAQLILLQLNDLFNTNKVDDKVGVPTHDLEAIQELKDYLSQNFLHDHSMNSLSKHIGLNTNKLMYLFKKVFEKSIFEFIAELRMEYAQKQLREKDVRVVDVARLVGYKNPNHFSAAFKKPYGRVPSQFK